MSFQDLLKTKLYDWLGLDEKERCRVSFCDFFFNIKCCTIFLPGLNRADLLVVAVHIMVVKGHDGGLR